MSTNPAYHARAAIHPVNGRRVYWGEVHIEGRTVFGIGPFYTQPEAIAAAITNARGRGCEPISLREYAERIEQAPLRSVAPQMPCDIGLFGSSCRTEG